MMEMLVFPPFRLDMAEERLWRGSSPVDLSPRTYAILEYLVERPGRLVRINEILEAIWGPGERGDRRATDRSQILVPQCQGERRGR